MSNMSQHSVNHLPTDEELEAEAARQREKSRREAERILYQEAETRRLEDRVLAMLNPGASHDDAFTVPPSLPQAVPGTPPSPSNSQKNGWWTAAKNKLTPTKEPLTPAQQIIQEAKTRDKEIEKEKEKERKELEKERKELEKEAKKLAKKQEKRKSKEWPSSPENKFDDPAFIQLGAPATRPRQMSSPSPSPMRQSTYSMPASLTASPLRLNASEGGTSSPSRQAPPMYTQFNSQGTLDIPGTLLTIASRFEKLEKWTVGHVRALEERMDDVERWLVEKEAEKDNEQPKEKDPEPLVVPQQTGDPSATLALQELREELAEVQGRIGELGREMARMVSSPGNLASAPSRNGAAIGRAPSTSSFNAVRSISSNVVSTPRTSLTKDTTSPPVVTTPPPPSRTRLPYPTGDYATPPDSTILHQGAFSPPGSPPSSLSVAAQSITGLPVHLADPPSTGTSPSGIPRATSPVGLEQEPSSPPTLAAPSARPSQRNASVSPTPRKRYTVALGGPIMAPVRARERSHSRNQSRDFTGPISTSPLTFDDTSDSDDNSGANEETIGKAAARTAGLNIPKKFKQEDDGSASDTSAQHAPIPKRARPQSMYNGPASAQNILAPTPTTPLNTRLRSRSTDRFGLGFLDDPSTPVTPSTGRFVDPLQVRRQAKEALASAAPPPPKVMPGRPKVPVGQLVAFFDQEKA